MAASNPTATTIRRVASEADFELAKAIRFEVFVDEQQVPAAIEIDEHDAAARHWLVFAGEAAMRADAVFPSVIATARVVAKSDGTWKIGRVAVRLPWRGKGIGAELMRTILAEGRAEGAPGAMLESQVQAIPFYERLGFVAEGPEYDDAGIPHRLMRLRF